MQAASSALTQVEVPILCSRILAEKLLGELVYSPRNNCSPWPVILPCDNGTKSSIFCLCWVNSKNSSDSFIYPKMTHGDTHTFKHTKKAREDASDRYKKQNRAGKWSHVLPRTPLGLKGLVCACKPHAVNEEVHCGVDRYDTVSAYQKSTHKTKLLTTHCDAQWET